MRVPGNPLLAWTLTGLAMFMAITTAENQETKPTLRYPTEDIGADSLASRKPRNWKPQGNSRSSMISNSAIG